MNPGAPGKRRCQPRRFVAKAAEADPPRNSKTRTRRLTTEGVSGNLMALGCGAFVYQLGHGPLKAERRVRFPCALPLIISNLRSVQ